MAGAMDAELAIAVAQGGGLGSLPAAMLNAQQLREQVEKFRVGDRVEVLTSKNASPSRDWLGIVKTSSARSKIRSYFSKATREDDLVHGRDELAKVMRKHGLGIGSKAAEKALDVVAKEMNYAHAEDMLAGIGGGKTRFQLRLLGSIAVPFNSIARRIAATVASMWVRCGEWAAPRIVRACCAMSMRYQLRLNVPVNVRSDPAVSSAAVSTCPVPSNRLTLPSNDFPAACVIVCAVITGMYVVAVVLFACVFVQKMLMHQPVASVYLWLTLLLAILVIFTHRANIRRLIAGTESRFSFAAKSGKAGTHA